MDVMTSSYSPDEKAAQLFARYKRARETEQDLLPQVKEVAVQALRDGATVGQLSKLTGLTDEVFRRIARAEGVERLRPPTVGEQAVDELTTALNNQPADSPDVADRLAGIIQGAMLALAAIAATAGDDAAEEATDASDKLLAAMPALDRLADAMREAADRHVLAA